MLLGKRLEQIEEKINLPTLYLLMDPSVPFIKEEIRYFNNEKRIDFFLKIRSKLDFYKANYKVITGSWSIRERETKKIIKNLLTKKIRWSKIRH